MDRKTSFILAAAVIVVLVVIYLFAFDGNKHLGFVNSEQQATKETEEINYTEETREIPVIVEWVDTNSFSHASNGKIQLKGIGHQEGESFVFDTVKEETVFVWSKKDTSHLPLAKSAVLRIHR
jgi:hypothetical protein